MHGEDASLRTFLQGLGNENTIMEDREQAEKALRMMMGKKLIWKTGADEEDHAAEGCPYTTRSARGN